jgi:predicted Zn-dependent peptidase
MLADIVQHATFPEAELERERQVILQEFAEDEDDAFSTAFKLFDKMCFGAHPLAQPVIGSRRNIARFSRDDLLGYVQRQYTGPNVVVAAAGALDAQQVVEAAAASFGALPAGGENAVAAPAYHGGFAARRQPGVSQMHVVLGFPLPGTREPGHEAGIVAAALFGEGMSSPLMDEIRERRGLAYYVACSADLSDLAGQFVVEASLAPEHAEEYVTEVVRLLREHARAVDPIGLERARNQIAVRRLEVQERPFRLLEEAAQDVFVHGRLRAPADRLAAIEAVRAEEVQACFSQMLRVVPAVGVAGDVRRATAERLKALLSAPLG